MIGRLLAISGAGTDSLSIFAPVSPPAESIRDLSILIFAITGLIFLVVEGILLYCVGRFWQRGRNLGADATLADPPQLYGSTPIEVAWTVAPALIVFTLMLVTTRTLWEVEIPIPEPTAGDNALFVTVVGRQWWWELRYTHFNGRPLEFITANELHLPIGSKDVPRPVHLTLESADVTHSFWVPRLAGKTDLIPGHTNTMWFQTDRAGVYLGQCAEYCGTQHANMLIRVVAESPEDFDEWLGAQAKPAHESPEHARGKDAFLAHSCVNCHRVRGTKAQGGYAPDLTHLMSRATLASGMIPNTAANLDRWIKDPQQVKSGCLMPAFGLSADERDLIVQYLSTLR